MKWDGPVWIWAEGKDKIIQAQNGFVVWVRELNGLGAGLKNKAQYVGLILGYENILRVRDYVECIFVK